MLSPAGEVPAGGKVARLLMRQLLVARSHQAVMDQFAYVSRIEDLATDLAPHQPRT